MVTLVLVPGAWHGPEAYNDLLPLLENYNTAPVELATVQKEGDTTERDMYDDVAAIRKVIEAALDRGENVVPIAHSYGGVPAGDACQGLTLEERKKEGQTNGVIGIIYLTAFALPVGQMLWNKEQMPDGMPWWQHQEKTVTPSTPEKIFYNQLPPDQAQQHVKKLRPHWTAAWLRPVTYAAFEHVPAAYLLCTADNAIPIDLQKMIVGFNSKGYALTREIDADHSPFLGAKKQECVTFIKEAVAEFAKAAGH